MGAKWYTPGWAHEWRLLHPQASLQADNPAKNKKTRKQELQVLQEMPWRYWKYKLYTTCRIKWNISYTSKKAV